MNTQLNEDPIKRQARENKEAQEGAAYLYENKLTVNDYPDLMDSKRNLVERALTMPSKKALIRFMERPEVKWKWSKLKTIEMPDIVRMRLMELREEIYNLAGEMNN